MRVVRDVFIASSSFTKAIQRNLQIDWKQSERKKQSCYSWHRKKRKALADSNDKRTTFSNFDITARAGRRVSGVNRFYQTRNQREEKTINKSLSVWRRRIDEEWININRSSTFRWIYNPFKKIAVADALASKYYDRRWHKVFAVCCGGPATRKRGDVK